MSLLNSLKGGGRHGVPSGDQRDAMGVLLATVQKVTTSSLLDRLGMRKQAEQLVFTSTSGGFRVAAAAGRTWQKVGSQKAGVRASRSAGDGVFDLTPTEDEQMLVDVVGEYAAELVRPAAAAADEACATPPEVLAAGLEIGLPMLGVPEALGGIAETRSAMAGTLVAEALARGDMGIAVAALAPGAVATALGLWGTEEQQRTYLPAFTGEKTTPAATLALSEPRVLFDPLEPATTATRTDDGFLLSGTKSAVVRGAEAELFVVGATLDGLPTLFLLESGPPGLEVEADPSMGLRAAALTRLTLTDVRIPAGNVLGDADSYRECVRLSRLAWCALSLGTAQAVLDYVTPYVKERQAFGEPIAHRQSVAFMVANIAIELQAMRALTYKAASRAARGKDVARDVAWARKLCAEKAMQIGNDGVQLLGGHGFIKEHPVERWYRDLRAIGLMEGAVLV
ncbi:hypothetical protein SAMN04487968_10770 [Nocardioides terrae]|uniref:Acyl-CoA dehydrogenase n=1 Tax=Nocardioides terrae TaxID=574651 RepID=A0A1I1JT09_9ACTN|nr:acyl-CoA dehydrogenase family protein [Nocardioides terrae]SFC49658.1 hypothetical protein SAMN04487968_10770 [Nocardioides terrae]